MNTPSAEDAAHDCDIASIGWHLRDSTGWRTDEPHGRQRRRDLRSHDLESADDSSGAHEVLGEASRPQLKASWARHTGEVREAQQLRHRVYIEGSGAHPIPSEKTTVGYDVDRFDAHCQHLVVRAFDDAGDEHGRVVGACRVMKPDAALQAGGLCSDDHFEQDALDAMRPTMLELGRPCVDPGHRQGVVIMLLWSCLAPFMHENNLRWILTSVSLPTRDGGHHAASLWHTLMDEHAAPTSQRVVPRRPLPLHQLRACELVETPPMVGSFLRCGGVVIGAPALVMHAASLPMLIDLQAHASSAHRPDADL